MNAPSRIREAVRVLLLDGEDRILLQRLVEPISRGVFWLAVGGGIDPGEGVEAAARREVSEETGLTEVALGPCVWLRRHAFSWNGRVVDQRERYLLGRTAETAVAPRFLTEEEVLARAELRWWTLGEIARSREVFVPRRLADLLAPLLAGDLPPEPLVVGA